MRQRRRQIGAVAATFALAALLAACGSATTPPRAAPVPRHHHAVAAAAPVDVPDPGPVAPPGSTLVATTDGAIPGYAAPNTVSNITVPGSWYGYPSILPVIDTQPGWLEVRLAQRPNGSTTWVPQSDVTLSSTPYSIVIDLATMHLSVYQDGTQILDFPAGIGAPDDPTPTGEYFVAMQVPPPDPGYGAFVLATSDHSDSIADWEGSGDAIIGIHGPITSYDDSLIGTTGAAISHGCVRLHDADLSQLAMIPAGTPLDVVN
jgi:lipoprotein-anchoring transpeptidase ErfK/SrfK